VYCRICEKSTSATPSLIVLAVTPSPSFVDVGSFTNVVEVVAPPDEFFDDDDPHAAAVSSNTAQAAAMVRVPTRLVVKCSRMGVSPVREATQR
jgi:hypothetical protein